MNKKILLIIFFALTTGAIVFNLANPVKKSGKAADDILNNQPSTAPLCANNCFICRLPSFYDPDNGFDKEKEGIYKNLLDDKKNNKIASFQIIVEGEDIILKPEDCSDKSHFGDKYGGNIDDPYIIFKAGVGDQKKFTCKLQINYPEGNPLICSIAEGLQKCYPNISSTPTPTPTPSPEISPNITNTPTLQPTIQPTDYSSYQPLQPTQPTAPTIPIPTNTTSPSQSLPITCQAGDTDLNNDGVTNSMDFAAFAVSFKNRILHSNEQSLKTDINCDKQLDLRDVEILRKDIQNSF